MGGLTGSACRYCGISVKIYMVRLSFTSLQKMIVNRIFSTISSFRPQPCASGHTCAHMYQRTRVVSKRRTGWSSKLLDILKQVILLWVYKVVDMKYSRWGGTKVLSAIEVLLSSNGRTDSIGSFLL
jgi:hypothetical protein